jgi:hypothetical protein
VRRRADGVRERRVEQLLTRLFRRSPILGEHVLRTMAKKAVSTPRTPASPPRLRTPWALSRRWTGVAVGLALVVGSGLGFGLGTSFIQSGRAAQGPLGIGFLPADGWNVLQSGARATPERPAYATAANVSLDPEDVVAGGLPDPSGLPYETLLRLRPEGIVIVAAFTRRRSYETYLDSRFPTHKLPLRLSDATPYIESGTQIRPDEPLGQYQIRAAVSGYDVDLNVYFGTPHPSPALLDEARRQLDRLVVRSPSDERANAGSRRAASSPRVVDRTIVCATALTGGVRKVEVRGHAGIREGASRWKQLPFAVFSTGSVGARLTALDNSLAWLTAGVPSGTTTMDIGFNQAWPHTTGTVALNRRWCRTSAAKVDLSPARLSGGPAGVFGEGFDCVAPRRVLVRVRAVFGSSSALHGDGLFVRTNTPVREAHMAMQTESGRALAFAEVLESGKTRLFTAGSCSPD